MPGELEHFGLMDESTEMYAGKGTERTFSFLHLSLQEYLAAWHLANSYSIHFQVAYHELTLNGSTHRRLDSEEASLIAKLEPIASTLLQPAMFLAGITGWRCQSGLQNPWEQYLSHYGLDRNGLLCSLYEAQNPSILRTASLCSIFIGFGSQTPYDCYAASYCLSHCSCKVGLVIYMSLYNTSLVETFFQGVYDHCKATLTQVKSLTLCIDVRKENVLALERLVDKFLTEINSLNITFTKEGWSLKSLLKLFARLKSLSVRIESFEEEEDEEDFSFCSSEEEDKEEESSLCGSEEENKEELSLCDVLPSLKHMKKIMVTTPIPFSVPPSHLICWALENSITELKFDIQLPFSFFDVKSQTASFINDLLKSLLRSKQIEELALPNISRENMANVHAIISECPSLVELYLIKSRLGYDGILYICSALKNNTSLKKIIIQDVASHLEPSDRICAQKLSFKIQEIPNIATYTDFILELNEILRDNITLKYVRMNIARLKEYWVEFCPGFSELPVFEQLHAGNGTCLSHRLKRSYSSSDLTQPKTTVVWCPPYSCDGKRYQYIYIYIYVS